MSSTTFGQFKPRCTYCKFANASARRGADEYGDLLARSLYERDLYERGLAQRDTYTDNIYGRDVDDVVRFERNGYVAESSRGALTMYLSWRKISTSEAYTT